MEMPEGFMRIIKQGYNANWRESCVGIDPIDMVHLLKFLKEMAEVLEQYEGFTVELGAKGGLFGQPKELIWTTGPLNPASIVLKKFRDWK